jgi:signal transduction histidine kinase
MIRTLRARLILSHLLPILIVVPLIGLAAFVLLQLQRSITNVETGIEQQAALLQKQAQVLSDAAGRLDNLLSDPTAANAFLSSISVDITGVTLLDAQGRVVAATNNAPPALGGNGEGQVAEVLRGQGAVQVEVTGESGRRLAELAIPVLGDQQQVQGVLLLSQELTTVSTQVGNLSALLIAIVVILFVLGILLGLLLALRLSRSLGQVTGALEGIARGETPATLPEHNLREVDALYQSVNTLAQRLRTLEDARKRLLANLVHELGRPLGSIRAAAHALRTGADDDPQLRQELLGGLNVQIERMQPLLDNLTLLHGQVLGSLELNPTPTPLAPWLMQVASLWREAAREKGILWKADIPLALPTAAVDADQMARAVGNLLSNAVKFTPPGGSITLDATVAATDEPGAADNFVLVVSDTGPGVPLAEQTRIFEPFQRGQGDRRFPQGVGLGLSIATDIVQAHGGAITLESNPGQGARFTLTVPLN